jgi:GNAT superfamily N-acetyltransferase
MAPEQTPVADHAPLVSPSDVRLRRRAPGYAHRVRLQVDLVQPDDAAVGRLIHAQIRELMETWQHRVVSEEEVDAELGPQPMTGVALVALARRGGEAVGCGGLRVVEAIGELTKVYVVPAARGTGVGEAVVGAVEQAARDRGLRLMRLDTRADLPAPTRLYRRLGYREVTPWHDGPYADHFFTKDL